MSNKNTGGPAFPVTSDNYADSYCGEGLSIRDYFAAKAMQGMMAEGQMMRMVGPNDLANVAYEVADAMLKARGE